MKTGLDVILDTTQRRHAGHMVRSSRSVEGMPCTAPPSLWSPERTPESASGSRDLHRGLVAAEEIRGDALAVQLDVTDAESIAAAAERVRSEFGRLDVLI